VIRLYKPPLLGEKRQKKSEKDRGKRERKNEERRRRNV